MVREAVTLTAPGLGQELSQLRVGDVVYLTGVVYTMRDRAHERLFQNADRQIAPPVDLSGGVVWHCGPAVSKKDDQWIVSSAGSTTSFRLTLQTPRLLREFGAKVILGKGGLGPVAVQAIVEQGAVFLAAVGGCAAYYGQRVKRVKNVYWEDLGLPEAIWELEVEKLGALVVAIDSHGHNLYTNVRARMGNELAQYYSRLGINPGMEYIFWPPHLPGTTGVAGYYHRDDIE